MSHILEFSPHHPDYDLATSPSFSDCYDLVNSIVCPIDGHRPPAVVVGPTSQKVCALCGEAEGETSFSKEAHTLPASFGNRHHTSNEECDQCNAQYGSEYEEHLALWLNPERTLHRVRRRPGEAPPTLQGPNGNSIEVDGSTGALVLRFDKEQVDRMLNPENREIEISYIRPACNQVSALRSLLKTAWLLLSPEQRLEHPLLLRLIKKEFNLQKWELWDLTPPGPGYGSVQFEVWKKKTHASIAVAPLMIRFILGNTILIWVEPNEVTATQIPSPLPPVRARASEDDGPTIHAKLLELKKDEIFPEKRETIGFTYKSLTKGSLPLPLRKAPKPIQQKIMVSLEHEGEGRVSLKTECYLRYVDSNKIRLFLSGNELAGSIIIQSDSTKERSSAKINLETEKHLPMSVLKTINLFKSFKEKQGRILIKNSREEELFILDSISDAMAIPTPPIENVLTDLITLNEEFGTELKYRKSASNEDLSDLIILSTAIRQKGLVELSFLNSSLTIHSKKKGVLSLLKAMNGNGPSEFQHKTTVIYDLWGTQLPALERTVVLPMASTGIPLNQIEQELENLEEDSSFGVPLISEKIIYKFERWEK